MSDRGDGVRIEAWDGKRATTCGAPGGCDQPVVLHADLSSTNEWTAELAFCEAHLDLVGEQARAFLVATGVIAPVTDLDRSIRAVAGEHLP